MLLTAQLEGEPGDQQRPAAQRRRTAKGQPPVTTTAILAVIGGAAVILTAAARIPAALAEFLRACILVVAAARDLRDSIAKRSACSTPASANPEVDVQRTPDVSAGDFGN